MIVGVLRGLGRRPAELGRPGIRPRPVRHLAGHLSSPWPRPSGPCWASSSPGITGEARPAGRGGHRGLPGAARPADPVPGRGGGRLILRRFPAVGHADRHLASLVAGAARRSWPGPASSGYSRAQAAAWRGVAGSGGTASGRRDATAPHRQAPPTPLPVGAQPARSRGCRPRTVPRAGPACLAEARDG